jgi:hypothetical protein
MMPLAGIESLVAAGRQLRSSSTLRSKTATTSVPLIWKQGSIYIMSSIPSLNQFSLGPGQANTQT